MICKTTQRNRKELFFVSLPRRQNNVALSPPPPCKAPFFYKTTKRSQGAIYCRFVKATKQCRFEPPPPCKALFLVTMAKRQRNISLRGMGLLSPWVGKETKQHFFEGVGSQAWTKALGLGAYTHAHLKPAKLYSKLKGSANSGAPWGLAVADTPI